MLLTKTVSISLYSLLRKKTFYRNKGYDLSTSGNENLKETFIEVKVEDLPPNHSAKINLACDYCGKEYSTTYQIYTVSHSKDKESKDCCTKCAPLKRKETNLRVYGVENPSQRQEIKDLKEQKAIEKYGCRNVLQSQEIKDKIKKTNLVKYGVENHQQNEDVKKKTTDTNIKKFGVPNPMQNEKIKNKMRKTLFDKHNSSSFIGGVTWRKQKLDNMLSYVNSMNYRVVTTIEDFFNQPMDSGFNIEVQCMQCNNVFNIFCSSHFFYDNTSIRCKFCNNQHTVSKQEDMFFQFIRDIYPGEIVRNSRELLSSKKEIDIYIPELKLGIEYNGLTWHSEVFGERDRNYHLNKHNEAKDKGISLISFTNHEWLNKEAIVKSMVKNRLGLVEKTIYARQCEIKEVDSETSFIFFNSNHIQGVETINKSGVNVGLFFDNELVSLVAFGKPRFTNKYEWELLRFCNKLNTRITGGFTKILNFFEKNFNPKSLLTYSEIRLFDSSVYERGGFIKLQDSHPNYVYIKNGVYRGTRYKFQKKKLSKVLEIYDENLTEWENMKNNGYDRVWDCGNRVFVKFYP